MGRKAERVGQTLVIRHDLPLGFYYLYASRPPIADAAGLEAVAGAASGTGAIFLKIDPPGELRIKKSLVHPVTTRMPHPLRRGGGENPRSTWEAPAFRLGGNGVHDSRFVIQEGRALQPRETLLIDCRKNEEELLGAMHPKTRYNIRLAERHGVRARAVAGSECEALVPKFWQLLFTTSRRDGFSLHPQEYYRILFDVRSADFQNELWVAELGGDILAAAIVSWYSPSSTATYLHGASSRERHEAMAPHLLQWAILREVRRRGVTAYDFGGIDEQRWPGVTRFKRGFGGTAHIFPPSMDILFRPGLYRLYRLQRFMRGRE